MISSRLAAVAMLGGMMKRTSIGVPRFSERVRDLRRGPVGVAAAGLAVAAGAPPFVGAVSLGAAGVWFAGLVVSAGFR